MFFEVFYEKSCFKPMCGNALLVVASGLFAGRDSRESDWLLSRFAKVGDGRGH